MTEPTSRISAGDYVLVTENGESLWRITRYEEDGSAWSFGGEQVRGWFWTVARFNGTFDQAGRLIERDPEGFLAWDLWDHWESMLRTKREAVRVAHAAAAARVAS